MKTFLVDDDSFCRTYYSQLLQNEKFEDLHLFNSGAELLEHLDERPDIIFLDYQLGDYEGLELIEKINVRCANALIVILSGQQDIDVIVKLMHKGVLDYIEKGTNEIDKIHVIKAKIESLQGSISETNEEARPSFFINKGKIKAKKELAEELHDNINPLLAASKLYLDTALASPNNSQEYIVESKAIILTAIKEIRTLCHSYATEAPKESIEQRLEEFLGLLLRQQEIKFLVDVQIKGLSNVLTTTAQHNLFLVIKELVNNLIKYSNSAVAEIKVYQKENEIELIVKDYGKGFNAKIEQSGIGTKNVINRIKHMKGTFTLSTQPGKGCAWSVRIPKI